MAKEAWQEVPFHDFLGQEIKEGDFLAHPYKHGNIIRLNILYCDGYQEKGVVLRELNRRTGNWVRVYPKWSTNIVKISVDGIDVTEHIPVWTERARNKVRKPNEPDPT